MTNKFGASDKIANQKRVRIMQGKFGEIVADLSGSKALLLTGCSKQTVDNLLLKHGTPRC